MNPEIQRIVSLVQDNSVDELTSLFAHADANETQVGGSHYASEYQHWDFMADLRPAWPEGCMSKYLARVFKKNGIQDVEKVLHYCYKLMYQVYLGKADVPRGLTVAQRADLYVRFYRAQNLQAPTQDMLTAVKDCFRHLSSWETLRDLRIVFQSVLDLHKLMTELESDTAAEEPGPSYVDPDRDLKTKETPVLSADAQSIRGSLHTLAGSLGFISGTQLVFPISVHQGLVESLRRSKNSGLPLTVFNAAPSFCSDYSEACLKIDVGVSALDESLPNQQLDRSLAALGSVIDGTLSLVGWFVQRVSIRNQESAELVGILPLLGAIHDMNRDYAASKLTVGEINTYLGAEVYT